MAKTRMLEDLREMLVHELDTITKKGDISNESLEFVSKLTESIKNVDKIMKQEQEQGQSNSMGNSFMNGNYSQNGSYNRGGQSNDYSRNTYGMMSNAGGSYDMNNTGGSYNGGSYNQYDYAGRGSYDNYGSNDGGNSNARRGRDGDGDGRYSEGESYARHRDRYGRYSRERGYSRHSAKDRVIEHLENMLDDSQNDSERIAIMRCIDELQN